MRHFGDEVALESREVGLSTHEYPDQDDAGDRGAAEADDEDAHQQIGLQLAEEEHHGSHGEQERGWHDDQRNEQDDYPAVSKLAGRHHCAP